MNPNRAKAMQQRLLANQQLAKARQQSSGGQMRDDRQRTQPSTQPIMGATSQAVQAPTIQAKPGLGQMARGMAMNAAMNKGMEVAEPYAQSAMETTVDRIKPLFAPRGSLPGSTAATANMENLVTPSRVAQTAATENIGAQTGLLKGAEAAAQPGFMSMLSGLGAQMGPMMMQYGMPLLGAYALSRMLSQGGYIGPLSKKG